MPDVPSSRPSENLNARHGRHNARPNVKSGRPNVKNGRPITMQVPKTAVKTTRGGDIVVDSLEAECGVS